MEVSGDLLRIYHVTALQGRIHGIAVNIILLYYEYYKENAYKNTYSDSPYPGKDLLDHFILR